MKEVVCFFLKNRELGVDVSQMKTIANRADVVPREKMPDFVKGIVSVHGEQIPLVDVDQLLRIPEETDTQKRLEKKYAIFQSRCGDYAMECDGISEIASVEDTSVRGVPGFFDQDNTSYADCVIQKKNHALVVVINPDRLLTDKQCAELRHLIDDLEKERLEAERKRIEEERRRKEEERKKREEEIAKMQEAGESPDSESEPEAETQETPENESEDGAETRETPENESEDGVETGTAEEEDKDE